MSFFSNCGSPRSLTNAIVEYFQKRERNGHSFKQRCWTHFEYPIFSTTLRYWVPINLLLVLLCCHYLPLDFGLLEGHGFIECHIACFIQIRQLSSWHPIQPYFTIPGRFDSEIWDLIEDWDLTGAPCELSTRTHPKCGGVQEEHSHWGQMLLAMPRFVSWGTKHP